MTLFYKTMESPVGRLVLIADRNHLLAVRWENKQYDRDIGSAQEDVRHPVLLEAEKQLNEYFAGARKSFRLPLPEPLAGTEFQNRVWKTLRDIPYGETISYEELARRIGKPSACRAVGGANGRNAIPIVIPCHRVIGKSGTLTGFGGGLDRKETLLNLERAVLRKNSRPPSRKA